MTIIDGLTRNSDPRAYLQLKILQISWKEKVHRSCNDTGLIARHIVAMLSIPGKLNQGKNAKNILSIISFCNIVSPELKIIYRVNQ